MLQQVLNAWCEWLPAKGTNVPKYVELSNNYTIVHIDHLYSIIVSNASIRFVARKLLLEYGAAVDIMVY